MAGLPRSIPVSSKPIITLTSDFGLDDAYVGVMKGVILGINPDVTLVDICHTIEPQNIQQAAFVLSTAIPYFPQDTIHLVVVDPGVGGARRPIILETDRAIFVAPDNGVLSYVVHAASSKRISKPTLMRLPPPLQAFEIAKPTYWHHPVSTTFHGRDIFAPIAAHISLGRPLEELGQSISSINVLPLPKPRTDARGNITGHVVHIDHFGNLITSIARGDLPPGSYSIRVAGHRIRSLSRSYEDGQGLLALIGSSGHLEIALKEGSAARLLGSKPGDEVHIIRRQSGQAREQSGAWVHCA
ncbi:MAG: SAM-dependent chlorinase/fluorinase [Dehalococcoidia bacterium]|nr:SAM-dependent chlorinase/fluorinase [Dehalococcoidia bacterium]